MPLYRLFGLNPARTPKTSFTLGVDDISDGRIVLPDGPGIGVRRRASVLSQE